LPERYSFANSVSLLSAVCIYDRLQKPEEIRVSVIAICCHKNSSASLTSILTHRDGEKMVKKLTAEE
jgi:hypothetical protein